MKRNSVIFISIITLISMISSYIVSYAAQSANFDLGYTSGFYSAVAGDAIEEMEAYRATLPKEMNVYHPKEPTGEIKIFIDDTGNDSNDGTIDKPVKTLEKALRILDGYSDRSKGAVIYFREGTYIQDSTTTIPTRLSGTKEAPLYITAYNNENVVISGADFYTGTSSLAKNDKLGYRVKEQVADKVRVMDLSHTDAEYTISVTGPSSMNIDGVNFSPARYPNNGYMKFGTYNGDDGVGGVIDPGDIWNKSVADTLGIPMTGNSTRGFEFKMDTYKPTKWENNGDMWIYGRMSVDWDWGYYNVDYINPEIPSLKSKQPSDWGCMVTAYNQYYFLNVLEEIDSAGEMYFDNSTKKLYFYPSKQYTDEDEVTVRMPKSDIKYLLRIDDNCENVIINGIKFDFNAQNGIEIVGDNNVVQNCEFEAITSRAIQITGMYNGVSHCTFSAGGRGVGIYPLNSDIIDKKANKDSYIFVQNNYFEHLSGNAINLGGTTTRAVISHNVFNAIRDNVIYGDDVLDCIIEYNCSVGGAIDLGDGGDMYFPYAAISTKRNLFRYNIFDGDLPCGNAGRSSIYFDSFAQGNYMYGNYIIDKNIKVGDKQAISNNIYVAKNAFSGRSSIGYSSNFFQKGGVGEDFMFNVYDADQQQYIDQINLSLNNKYRYTFDYKDYYEDILTFRKARAYGGYTAEMEQKDAEFRLFDEIIYKDNLYYDYNKNVANAVNDFQDQNNIVTKDKDVFEDFDNGNYNIKKDSYVLDQIPSLRDLPRMEEINSETKVILEKPAVQFPFNDTTGFVSNVDLMFKWNECNGATYYGIEIAEDKDFTKPVVDTYIKGVYNYYSDDMADTGASVSGNDIKAEKVKLEELLKNDTIYYWRVTAYAQIPNADKKQAVSDVSSFRVGTVTEIRESEEADTSALQYAIEPYKTYLEKYMVEDDGTDHGFGVYKAGTKELLEKRIIEEENLLPTLKYNSDVADRVKKFTEDAYKIVSDNAIEYTRKLKDFNDDNFVIANSTNGVTFLNDGKEIEFSGTVQDVIAAERPLTPKEGIAFRYKPVEALSNWNTISIRQSASSTANVLGCNTYFLCFSGRNIEIQKISDSVGMNDRIIHTVENQDYLKVGQWNDIIASAINVEDGVRIRMSINGKEIIDFTDKQNPLYELGYASIMWNKGQSKCYISTVE